MKPYPSSFSGLIKRLESEGVMQVAECETSLEAVSLARRVDTCILLACVVDEDDIVKQITMLKLLAAEVSQKKVRVFLTSSVKSQIAMHRLDAYGVTEIIPEPTTEKGLYFKIDRLVKQMMKAAQRESRSKREVAVAQASKQKSAVSEADPEAQIRREVSNRVKAPEMKLVDPLTLESDCWVLTRDIARKLGGKWVVRLMGPPPELGRWMEISSEAVKDTFWQWVPTDSDNDVFIKEQGAWVFRGQRPEYQNEVWHFIGKEPALSFYYEGESYGDRVKVDESGDLLVARDSAAASIAYTQIQEAQDGAFKKAAKLDASSEKPGEVEEAGGEAPSELGDLELKPSGRRQQRVRKEPKIEMVEPLALESDVWLMEDRKPLRVGSRWSAKLTGPGTSAGKWVEVEVEEDPSQDDVLWKWIPTDPARDLFVVEEGEWRFRGKQPRFDGEKWVFIAQKPELGFYYEGTCYGAKLSCDDPFLLKVAQDSARAQLMLPQIQASCVKVIRQKSKLELEDEDRSFVRLKRDEGEPEDTDGRIINDDEEAIRDGNSVSADDEEGADEAIGKVRAELGASYGRKKAEEFQYDVDHFGDPEGHWQYVCPRAEGGKWYIFLPSGMQDGKVEDIRALLQYWLYWGSATPELQLVDVEGATDFAKVWIFRARRPEAVAMWDNLPTGVRSYLSQKNLTDVLKSEAEDMVEKDSVRREDDEDHEPSVTLDKEKKSKLLSAKAGKAAEGRELSLKLGKEKESSEKSAAFGKEAKGKELSLRMAKSGEGKDLSLNLGKEKEAAEKSATSGKTPLGKDLTLKTSAAAEQAYDGTKDLHLDGGAKQAKQRAVQMGKNWEGKELSAKTDVTDKGDGFSVTVDEKQAKVLEFRDKSRESVKSAMAKGEPVSAGFVAPRPKEALFSPIAMAFLMSELMSKRDATVDMLAQRYCMYVSASCQGAHVELWAKLPPQATTSKSDEWKCLATHDGSPGVLSSNPNAIRVAIDAGGRGLMMISFHEGSAPVSNSYLQAIAIVARGLIKAA